MLAGTLNFTIPKDTDQTLSFTIAGYDLRTHTAKLQIRKSFNDASPIISLTKDSGITLGNGTFTWTFTNAQTNLLSAGNYVYSFKIYDSSGNKTRLIEGVITVTAEPTR